MTAGRNAALRGHAPSTTGGSRHDAAACEQLALVGVPVLIVAGALGFWLQGGRHVTTENAFVKADITQIASEVPGRIIEVRIRDHAVVAAGEVLVRLDPAPYGWRSPRPRPRSIPRAPPSSSSRRACARSGPKPRRPRTS